MMMIVKKIYIIFFGVLAATFLSSFWLFSRFTVDDAFITWRYGKNLIQYGVWNYNPAHFDLTQAYTNPIYALLSIIPHYFDIDVVLFFKLFSLATLVIFCFWFVKKAGFSLLFLLFLALPATVIHVFSGLETFFYVACLTVLLVKLYENKFWSSLILTVVLFLTRPEAWLFVFLVPLYFLIQENNKSFKSFRDFWKECQFDWKKFAIAVFFLSFFLCVYFWVHYRLFGNLLPNTFYIKAGVTRNVLSVFIFSIFILPLVFLLINGWYKIFGFGVLFLLLVTLNYSLSKLQMNYAARFVFHTFAPVFLFSLFYLKHLPALSVKISFDPVVLRNIHFSFKKILSTFLALTVFLFLSLIGIDANFWHITSYDRLTHTNGQLGLLLKEVTNKYNLKTFSFGDAGITAYHSELIALDNIGLGSSLVGKQGMNLEIMDHYNPQIVIFHSNPSGISLSVHHQKWVYDWVVKNNFKRVCRIYHTEAYVFGIYSALELPELKPLCQKSKSEVKTSLREQLLAQLKIPPWQQWNVQKKIL